jgi:signal transduction histidine kinase
VSKNFPPCFLDRLAVSRLLTNLLDNAVKFTAPGGAVAISAECADNQVVLKVTDTGIGIPPEDQASVFQKCKRSRRKNRYTSGCGLGLYICSEIVTAHGGRISFVSQVGVGTTFSVVLPIKSAMAKSTEDRQSSARR